MKIKIFCGSIICILLLDGCRTIPKNNPTYSSCTFTIPEPLDYECYRHKDGSGGKIQLSINVVTKYANPVNNGPNLVDLDDQSITFDPSVNSFPVTIAALIPDDGTPWSCYINIKGT